MKIDFKPVFDYIDKAKQELMDELPSKEDYRTLQNVVEASVVRTETHDKEIKGLNYRTTNMEDWVIKAAPKVDIPYET